MNWQEEVRKSADRKAKREEKRKSLPWANHAKSRDLAKIEKQVAGPQIRKKRKPARISSRRQALNRLKETSRKYVLLRAKFRLGHCEVGIACGGFGSIEVWYHVFPQASGNRLKYDDRCILGSCNWCNAGEYEARKNSNYTIYESRHQTILGKVLYEHLKSIEGRYQISTVEANQVADEYEQKIKELNEKRA